MLMIEALMALTLLGLIAAAFLGALGTANKATLIADEQTTAESLARSQMEHIKISSYINFSDPEHGDYELVTPPDGYDWYSVEVIATPIDPDTGQSLSLGEDLGLQKTTVSVKHYDKEVVTLEGYKVDR